MTSPGLPGDELLSVESLACLETILLTTTPDTVGIEWGHGRVKCLTRHEKRFEKKRKKIRKTIRNATEKCLALSGRLKNISPALVNKF